MARITTAQAAQFPTGGRSSFLALQNDKDSAKVRFAYTHPNDIPVHLIHEVYDGNNRTNIGCLKTDFSSPDSVCPLCQSGNLPKQSIYFNVLNDETGEMQLWQRSFAFFNKNLSVLFDRLTQNGTPLCSIPFEIVRNGVKGDMKTTYQVFYDQADSMTIDSFPKEIVVEDEGIIKEFTFDELQNYINTGQMPQNNNQNNQAITPRQPNPMQQAPIQPNPVQQPPVNQASVHSNGNRGRRTIGNNNGGY